jgi:hopanoid biosynthesis associated RND transporter like protein HpnN
VLALILVVTVLIGAYTATHLGVNADENAMLSNELPHRIFELEYQQIFPGLYENIVVVVDAETPEQASSASNALAERMEAAPELFHSVFRPAGPFFESHALLYLDTEELEDLADRLARLQPYLAGLAEDGSLRGLTMLMARGARGVRDRDVGANELTPLLERFHAAVQAWNRGESYQLSWAEVLAGHDLDADASRRFIIIQPVLDFSDLAPARNALMAVKRFAAELGLDEANGVRVRMTGDAALAFEEMQLVEGQAAMAGLASFAIVAILLFVAMRSLRLVLATLITLVVGLVWTAGFAALAIGHLNLISVAFAVLFIGLGVDFGLHFCMRYQELVAAGHAYDSALRETARGVGGSLILCSVTTAVGFYAFSPTDFAGVAELGVISGTGMFISVFHSFTLLPALVSLRRRDRITSPEPTGTSTSLPSFPMRHPRAVAIGALLLGAAAVTLLPQVRFDQNPLRVRDPSAESVQVLEDLLAKGSASTWEISAVANDLESARELASRLSELEVVERAITVADFIPGQQVEKLEIIEDVKLFLAPSNSLNGSVREPSVEEQLDGLRELRDELERWMRDRAAPPVTESAREVHADLVGFLDAVGGAPDAEEGIASLQSALLGSLPEQLRSLERALSPGVITLESLPRGLLERMLSEEGKARVRVLPAEDLGDNAALERFVEQVRTVTPDLAGGAINIYEASKAVVRAFQQAFAAAIIVIALLLFLIWRTLGETALVLTPLALAAIFTGAATVLLDIPFNFADVIVLPLLLGIGVDSGIHLVHRARMLETGVGSLLQTSTAGAVVFSSVTTIASFGSLAFASHRGMASLGQLLALGVALTVICNLLVLPALIEWRDRRRLGID